MVAAPDDGEVAVTVDVPSGRVVARVRTRSGAVDAVTFCNVPAFVVARGVAAAGVTVDVAYGDADAHASARAADFGLRVVPEDLPGLIAAGRAVKLALEGTDAARRPRSTIPRRRYARARA